MRLHRDTAVQQAGQSSSTEDMGGPKVDVRGFTLDEARMEDLRQIYRDTEAEIKACQIKEAWLLGTGVISIFVWLFLACAAGVLFSQQMSVGGAWLLGLAAAGFACTWCLHRQLAACEKANERLEGTLADLERRTALSPISLRS